MPILLYVQSITSGALLLSLESESAIVSLLLLHPELPLLGDLHVVVPEPDEVLPVAPVAREHLLAHGCLLSVGYFLIYVPVFLAVYLQAM